MSMTKVIDKISIVGEKILAIEIFTVRFCDLSSDPCIWLHIAGKINLQYHHYYYNSTDDLFHTFG